MSKILHKAEALFVLYDKYEESDDMFPIYITNSVTKGNYSESWFDFQPELDELSIISYDDQWICENESNRYILKEILEKRGFKVILGEKY
jgi:D-alanyl-D-alanine dipeptidase